jgi:hypothetical protein
MMIAAVTVPQPRSARSCGVCQIEVAASDDGSLDALRFAAGIDEERVWALEDCRHVSARLEGALIAAGEQVIRVPAEVTGQTRKTVRVKGKSDPIDARAVALAVVRTALAGRSLLFARVENFNQIRWLEHDADAFVNSRIPAHVPHWLRQLRWGRAS